MTPDEIDQAAQLLTRARVENTVLDGLPEHLRPRDLREAYAVQDRLIALLGLEVGGWFCACTNPSMQRILGLTEPYYARLLRRFIFSGPAVLEASAFPPIVLECEFAFRLAQDLPARSASYTREEVATAVASVHPAIEVVAGHLRNWPRQDVWSVIADNGTDGALVHGDGRRDWRSLDLPGVAVHLRVNGELVRHGRGSNVLGDPLQALVWLANARRRDGDGLRAGDLHNTGTATDIIWLQPGDSAVATFEGLGEVSLRLAAR
jgi:2-keto-4-pentenoate hydratase